MSQLQSSNVDTPLWSIVIGNRNDEWKAKVVHHFKVFPRRDRLAVLEKRTRI